LQDAGNLDQAIAVLCRAVAVDPGLPKPTWNLARARNAAGDPAGAQSSSEQAIALDPALAEAHVQRARGPAGAGATMPPPPPRQGKRSRCNRIRRTPTCCSARPSPASKDYAAAEAAYRAADRLSPDRYEVLVNLGMVLAELRQDQDAVRCCRRAVRAGAGGSAGPRRPGRGLAAGRRRGPRPPRRSAAPGTCPGRSGALAAARDNFSLLGRFDAAADLYRRALDLDPGSPEGLSGLATIGKLTDPEGAKVRLATVLSDAGFARHAAADRGFALGALLDEATDYDRAFAAYDTANRLARGTP